MEEEKNEMKDGEKILNHSEEKNSANSVIENK